MEKTIENLIFYFKQNRDHLNYSCSDPLNQQSLIGFFAKTGGNP